MADLKGAKVIAVKALSDKLSLLTVELGGKQGDIKAWKNDAEGIAEGHIFQSGETEKKPPYNKPNAPIKDHETWLKSPPKSRGGGQPKSDPAKNKVIADANANNNATMAYSSNLKAAVTCAELSVQILGPGQDINKYREVAFDIYQTVRELAAIGSKEAK